MKRALIFIGCILFLALGIPALCFHFIPGVDKTTENESQSLYFSLGTHTYRKPVKGEIKTITDDCYNYDEIMIKLRNNLLLPSCISSGNAQLLFYCDSTFANNGTNARGEVYLEWTVDQTIFSKEKERIGRIKFQTEKKSKSPLWSNDLFSLPGYIASYNYRSMFEYALFDDTSFTIRYIYLFDIGTTNNILFPHEFEPKKTISSSDLKQNISQERFCIYSI